MYKFAAAACLPTTFNAAKLQTRLRIILLSINLLPTDMIS